MEVSVDSRASESGSITRLLVTSHSRIAQLTRFLDKWILAIVFITTGTNTSAPRYDYSLGPRRFNRLQMSATHFVISCLLLFLLNSPFANCRFSYKFKENRNTKPNANETEVSGGLQLVQSFGEDGSPDTSAPSVHHVDTHPNWTSHADAYKQAPLSKPEQRVYDTKGAVDMKDVPYLVALMYDGVHSCGGSLVRPDLVLTAAHCLIGYQPRRMHIRAGAASFNESGAGVVEVNVVRTLPFPDYTFRSKDGDIGLVWLSEALPLSDVIQPIELARAGDQLPGGTLVTIAGYGAYHENGSHSNRLQAALVPVMHPATCAFSYTTITPHMLCAGYPQGGTDACQYDSGGPLSYNGTLYGVISWGRGCARPGNPGVYANLANLRNWIDRQTTA